VPIYITVGGIPELETFHDHLKQYKIVVYTGLNCDMFDGQVESSERINLLYDDVTHHHVIANLTGVMAKKFVKRAARAVVETSFIHVI
jgi:hypothetical protein